MKEKSGISIRVKITPRSSKNEISGVMDDGTIKIKLTAPPVDGKANLLLVKFLSDKFHLPTESVKIISGEKSRIKLISIIGITTEEIIKKIG